MVIFFCLKHRAVAIIGCCSAICYFFMKKVIEFVMVFLSEKLHSKLVTPLHWRAYKFQFRVRSRRQIGQLSFWCYLPWAGLVSSFCNIWMPSQKALFSDNMATKTSHGTWTVLWHFFQNTWNSCWWNFHNLRGSFRQFALIEFSITLTYSQTFWKAPLTSF